MKTIILCILTLAISACNVPGGESKDSGEQITYVGRLGDSVSAGTINTHYSRPTSQDSTTVVYSEIKFDLSLGTIDYEFQKHTALDEDSWTHEECALRSSLSQEKVKLLRQELANLNVCRYQYWGTRSVALLLPMTMGTLHTTQRRVEVEHFTSSENDFLALCKSGDIIDTVTMLEPSENEITAASCREVGSSGHFCSVMPN